MRPPPAPTAMPARWSDRPGWDGRSAAPVIGSSSVAPAIAQRPEVGPPGHALVDAAEVRACEPLVLAARVTTEVAAVHDRRVAAIALEPVGLAHVEQQARARCELVRRPERLDRVVVVAGVVILAPLVAEHPGAV